MKKPRMTDIDLAKWKRRLVEYRNSGQYMSMSDEALETLVEEVEEARVATAEREAVAQAPVEDQDIARNEFHWTRGYRAAWTSTLASALSALGYTDSEATRAKWVLEREAAIAKLREVCEEYGDNDWPVNLYLADIIDKHLFRNLYRAEQEEDEDEDEGEPLSTLLNLRSELEDLKSENLGEVLGITTFKTGDLVFEPPATYGIILQSGPVSYDVVWVGGGTSRYRYATGRPVRLLTESELRDLGSFTIEHLRKEADEAREERRTGARVKRGQIWPSR